MEVCGLGLALIELSSTDDSSGKSCELDMGGDAENRVLDAAISEGCVRKPLICCHKLRVPNSNFSSFTFVIPLYILH